MANLVDKKCASTEWFTPPEILEPVRKTFHGQIQYDPCTTYDNPTKAFRFTTKNENGLIGTWPGSTFVNPPYGKDLYDWIEKVVTEAKGGLRIILLVSASSRWDQAKWQSIYIPELTTFVMPRGRVKFLNEEGIRMKSPPYPSVLYFYNIDPRDVKECFGHLGTVVKQEVM